MTKATEEDNSFHQKLCIINNILENNCKSVKNPKFTLKEFTFLSKLKDINIKDEDRQNNDNMISKIKGNIKKELDTFLNFNFEGLITNDITNEIEKKKNFINKRDIYWHKKIQNCILSLVYL